MVLNSNMQKWLITRHTVNRRMKRCSTCLYSCAQSYLTLYDPRDFSPGSSVCGNFQGKVLEWVAISFSRGSPWPRDWTRVFCISCTGRLILHHWATWKPREIQIKTTVRYHLMPVRVAAIKRPQMTSVGEDVEKRTPSYTVGGNVNWHSLECAYGKQYGGSSNN